MRKFYATIIAVGVAFSMTASAQQKVESLRKASPVSSSEWKQVRIDRNNSADMAKNRLEAAKARKAAPAKREPMSSSELPDPSGLKYVDELPDGVEAKTYTKDGAYYSYNWLLGMSSGLTEGQICDIAIADGKCYLNSLFTGIATEGWLVGDVEGDKVTFKFPQWVDHYEDYDYTGNPYFLDTYCALMEWVPSEDDPDTGTWLPNKNQEITFTIADDGSLTADAEPYEWLFGAYEWVTDDGDPYWYYTYNGDCLIKAEELTAVAVSLPEGIETKAYNLISGITARQVNVGVQDDKMYIDGMFSRMPEAVIVGTIDGDKVSFENGQYLGIYRSNMTTVYMQSASAEDPEDPYFEIIPSLDFTWDKENNVIQASDYMVFSSIPYRIYYYSYLEAPKLIIPDASLAGKELYNPVPDPSYYFEYDPYYGDGEFGFNFPNVDKAGNILDPEYMYYNVYVDGELFAFQNDEYPDDVFDEPMVNVPYDFDGSSIYYNGTLHCVYFYFEGYDSIAVRTHYDDGKTKSESDLVYIVKDAKVDRIDNDRVVSQKFFDLLGRQVDKPSNGIFLRVATLDDGSVKTQKILKH